MDWSKVLKVAVKRAVKRVACGPCGAEQQPLLAPQSGLTTLSTIARPQRSLCGLAVKWSASQLVRIFPFKRLLEASTHTLLSLTKRNGCTRRSSGAQLGGGSGRCP